MDTGETDTDEDAEVVGTGLAGTDEVVPEEDVPSRPLVDEVDPSGGFCWLLVETEVGSTGPPVEDWEVGTPADGVALTLVDWL